jgi:conjugal transfer mating pair stabilization protein TraN
MGTDCASFPSEQSADFANAVAALQAAQMAVTDMQCAPGGSCVVFSGEANACKRAVGGIVNCCTTPDGVSLSNYISLIFAVGKIDSAILGLDKGAAIRGSWETLRQPIASTWSAVQESFTSVANTLTGQTSASATDAAASLGLDAFKQALLKQTAEWAAQLFGDAAVNALFSTTTGGTAVSGGVVAEGSVLQLGGGGAWLGTAMAWAMYAYLIYTVAVILIQLIWTCEQEEFELGAKRELRACHRVGGYCKSKVLGVCVEKRDSYCCFNTPLARIINEQVRPQLGRDWGEPDAPLCGGLSVTELARVDWSRVNLDEWLSILYETGHFPTLPTLTIDNLTGAGSELAVQAQGRADVAARTAQRADGIDSEQVRLDAEDELWGGTLRTLPSP